MFGSSFFLLGFFFSLLQFDIATTWESNIVTNDELWSQTLIMIVKQEPPNSQLTHSNPTSILANAVKIVNTLNQ